MDREAAAVREWLASPLPFHAMRDNPRHAAPIMAGLWGGDNYADFGQLRIISCGSGNVAMPFLVHRSGQFQRIKT